MAFLPNPQLDASGNGNNFTATNINWTSQSDTTYDMMSDVPTLTDEDTGNFCTYSGVDKANVTLSEGNLKLQATTDFYGARGTIALPSSGKFYWEVTGFGSTGGSLNDQGIGILSTTPTLNAVLYSLTPSIYFTGGGNIRVDNVATQTGLGAWTSSSDVLGIAVDMDALTIQFYLNNSTIGTTESLTSGVTYAASSYVANGRYHTINFGQRPFAYTPPTGYKKLNTYNLPDSSIIKGNEYMDTILYTGNGSTSRSITGLEFSPDLVWFKHRNHPTAHQHNLFDSVRGTTKSLHSNSNEAQETLTNGLTAFNSNGFTVGNNAAINDNSYNYVAWNWRSSDSAAVTNNDGSRTSTLSVNTTSGISIGTHTATSGTYSVGHGLGVTPDCFWLKYVDGGGNWINWWKDKDGTPTRFGAYFNSSGYGFATNSSWLAGCNASTISIVTNQVTGTSGTHIIYAFKGIEGFSKYSIYTGNGSSDGPFIYTGFRPSFLLYKRRDTSGYWTILDTKRDTYNFLEKELYPNTTGTENTAGSNDRDVDFLANGFKIKGNHADLNASGGTYIYMACAENPFKNSLAR